MDTATECSQICTGVKHWKLEKFDGELPQPGENKLPVEVIEGGDGLPTVTRYPQREAAEAAAHV